MSPEVVHRGLVECRQIIVQGKALHPDKAQGRGLVIRLHVCDVPAVGVLRERHLWGEGIGH